MPRCKQYKISARQTAIYDVIVAELQQNPELADYDMGTMPQSQYAIATQKLIFRRY